MYLPKPSSAPSHSPTHGTHQLPKSLPHTISSLLSSKSESSHLVENVHHPQSYTFPSGVGGGGREGGGGGLEGALSVEPELGDFFFAFQGALRGVVS